MSGPLSERAFELADIFVTFLLFYLFDETRGGGDGALGMANERCGSDAIELRLRSEGYLVIGFLSSLPYVALFYST